jgi:hypothetical protein
VNSSLNRRGSLCYKRNAVGSLDFARKPESRTAFQSGASRTLTQGWGVDSDWKTATASFLLNFQTRFTNRVIGVYVGRGCQGERDSDNPANRNSHRGDQQPSSSSESHGVFSRARPFAEPSTGRTLKVVDPRLFGNVVTVREADPETILAPYRAVFSGDRRVGLRVSTSPPKQ